MTMANLYQGYRGGAAIGFAFACLAAVSAAREARADSISLPQAEACATGGGEDPCLSITNTANNGIAYSGYAGGGAGLGLLGEASGSNGYAGVKGIATANSNGYGVVGWGGSAGYGVYGVAATGVYGYGFSGGVGVLGYTYGAGSIGGNFSSDVGNGLVATNTRTDWNAAAIAALTGSSSGLSFYGQGGIEVFGDAVKPGGGSWTAYSDERVKRDVKDFRSGLADLLRVRPVSYVYNGLGGTVDDGKRHVGVIAQELEKVLPSMVTSRKGKLRPADSEETDIRTVDPSDFTYILINAVQEQQQTIARQEARIAALEAGRRPALAGMNPAGMGGLGLAAVAGAVLASRRQKRRTERA